MSDITDPTQYPVTINDPNLQGMVRCYMEENLIHAVWPTKIEILELFPTKEIYYTFPESKAGAFYGIYSPSIADGRTYFIDKNNVTSGYVDVII